MFVKNNPMSNGMALFVFFILYFLIVFVLRSWLLWRSTGINPFTFDNSDDAHGYNGKLFKFLVVLEILVVSIYAFAESWHPYLLPFWYLEADIARIIGWSLLIASLIWTFIAQLQMSDAWRIGIDTKHKTELVSKGLFSLSRNPIFLGIIVADIGLFMAMPNAFTLLIGALSIVVIQTQVRLEEAYLSDVHGDIYTRYRKHVRRWV